MSLVYQQLLSQVEAKRKEYGSGLQPACSDNDLTDLQARARKELGIGIPPGYARFLRQHNGLNWNGLFIYASKTVPIVGRNDRSIHGFIDVNQWFRDEEWKKEFVVFGSSSLDLYVYEPGKKTYSARDRVSFDEAESYSSFDDLLIEALRTHL